MKDLEVRLAALNAQLAAPAPSPVRLHPSLPKLYRRKTNELAATPADPDVDAGVLAELRGLVERVTVYQAPEGRTPDREGAPTGMIGSGA